MCGRRIRSNVVFLQSVNVDHALLMSTFSGINGDRLIESFHMSSDLTGLKQTRYPVKYVMIS